MKSAILWILGFLHFCGGQNADSESERGFLLNRRRRPLVQQSSPCWSGHGGGYDAVDEDLQGRHLLLAAGAAVGGAALGYHIGMKHQDNRPIINNNIYNEYPPPCVVVQSGGGGHGGGGGLLGGILGGHHPILSNILSGGLGSGATSSASSGAIVNRPTGVNWNRAIRQFNRAVRPITRGFKR